MDKKHICKEFSPDMHKGLEIYLRWFGWCIEFHGEEIQINYCPLCGKNLEKEQR